MALSEDQLREIVVELATRPGHEKVRAQVHHLLVDGLGTPSGQIFFERPLPEVHGRLDALLGRTVFEFKSDLRREQDEAERQLADYLKDREGDTGNSFVGIATDGAEFTAYELRQGVLAEARRFTTVADAPRSLLVWLDAAVAVTPELPPDPETVREELGRESLAYEVARSRLTGLWASVARSPEAQLKRQLWSGLLGKVYGAPVDDDSLFLQHTYLTIVAKALAVRVLGLTLPNPEDLLSGKPFENAGISGAVEADFFNWILDAPGGSELVNRIARQASRFSVKDIQHDVLHALYESLIDPEQRHDLGEYYTPDWLAWRVCNRVIDRPLEQRVLDPACGSGTFLFHALRRFLAAADAAGLSEREALAKSCDLVIGIDIHPVAAIIARVTYLLALGPRLQQPDRPPLSIPAYLGDALQWNTRQFLVDREVVIEVPDGPLLRFPAGIASTPAAFTQVVGTMISSSGSGMSGTGFRAWLDREQSLSARESDVLVETYDALCELQADHRDHIWGYVAQNLSRPIWLSSADQLADVVVGNPPWLSYRYMSADMQSRFREECQRRGIWAGGRVATHQDLSAYFFARCVELYLKPNGKIAFVMPHAAFSRAQFAGFRTGRFQSEAHGRVEVFALASFEEAWGFDERVQPLFPVPSCVLIARKGAAGPLPGVVAYAGTLPRRDATWDEADRALRSETVPWPMVPQLSGGSPYRAAFRDGATIFPRVLCVVQPTTTGFLGGDVGSPLVRSQRTALEKRPWKDLPALEGRVEAAFLRPLYLGESIAPYRLLEPALAVIPWDDGGTGLLDAAAAGTSGFPHLAGWLADAERSWNEHRHGHMSFIEQLDYFGKLSSQMPIPPTRLVFAASGTLPAAAILADPRAIVEHSLYWIEVGSDGEGRYLSAILNSETARARVASMQARGQWGARHFDKVMFELPIPPFEPSVSLHSELAKAAERAEEVAARVDIHPGMHFGRARREVRQALTADGVAARIDGLVASLLGKP